MRLEINHQQAERMAACSLQLNWRSAGFPALEAALPGASREQVLDFFFFNSALLFDFYGFEAELHGQHLKGSDLFFALARRKAMQDPGFFTAARLANLSLAEYQAVYALDRDPAHTLINRGEERVSILRELGQGLLRDYQDMPGSRYLAARLLAACATRLRTPEGTGLLDRLVKFQGYSDPHLKKAFVLVKALTRLGLFNPVDQQHLFIPVDYHLIRMALRTGLVTITDPALADQLRSRTPASQDDDWELRQVIKLAYKQLEQAAGVDVFVWDEMFWTMGRSCCHYSRPPRCAGCDFTDCSVMTSFTYQCPGRCPLTTVCRGAQDETYRTLFEPQLVTTYY